MLQAFLRLGVLGNRPEPALNLVTKRLELSHEIARASSECLEGYRDDYAALLIAPDETGLLEIGEQRFANPYRYASRTAPASRARGNGGCSESSACRSPTANSVMVPPGGMRSVRLTITPSW